jgi:EmrB/QacA subfamily drug resistance transporter
MVMGASSAALEQDTIGDRRQRRLILGAMCLALVAVVSSVSGLNVAQQALAVDLDGTQGQVLWVINGYTVVLAALLLPVGAIGDRWGRKPVLLAGLVVFTCANVASGLAGSIQVLIALRVVAGVGAAMVMPVTLSVITTSFPREEQAKAIGTWAGFAGAGGIIGLFVSAGIIDNATWPWIFVLPVALAASSFAVSLRAVPHAMPHPEGRFDFAGSILSFLAVGGSVLAIHEGPGRGWTNTLTVTAIAVSAVASVGFIMVERRFSSPLLDVRMFADRALATGATNLFVVFGAMFSLFLVLVQHLQAVLGFSALRAASGLLPMALLMMPLSTAAPTLAQRFGYRRTVATGMLLLTAGLCLVAAQADAAGGYLSVLPGLVLLALGVGLAMSPSTAAITSSLPADKQGVASSLNDTVRELGGAVGIALVGSILNASYRSNVGPAVSSLPPAFAEIIRRGIGPALAGASQLGPAGEPIVVAARAAYVQGMRPALLAVAGMTGLSALFTAFRAPMRTRQR